MTASQKKPPCLSSSSTLYTRFSNAALDSLAHVELLEAKVEVVDIRLCDTCGVKDTWWRGGVAGGSPMLWMTFMADVTRLCCGGGGRLTSGPQLTGRRDNK
jgi:hypothetical protein